MSAAEAVRYRHSCADCRRCDGTADQPCSWGEFNDGHLYPDCPDVRGQRCGQPWAGCHHCGASTPCPEPCWYVARDAAGNPLMFSDSDVAS